MEPIAAEAKVLEGREVCQVGPQRLGTIGTDVSIAEVKVLEGREPVSYTHLTLPTTPYV